MNVHNLSAATGYGGLIATLSSFTMSETLQIVSLSFGIVFLVLGCVLRIMDIHERRNRKDKRQ